MVPGIMEDAGDTVSINKVVIKPLGAGQEVGRSCIIVKYMCDPRQDRNHYSPPTLRPPELRGEAG